MTAAGEPQRGRRGGRGDDDGTSGEGGEPGVRGDSGDTARIDAARAWILAETTRRRLVAFAQRFLGDRQEAEDVVQETLLRAGASFARLRSSARIEAWLFRICRHAAIDRVRARQVRRAVWAQLPECLEPEGPGAAGGLGGFGSPATHGDGAGHRSPHEHGGQEGGSALAWSGARRVFGASAAEGLGPDHPAPLPPGSLAGMPAHHRLLLRLHYERGLSQARLCALSGLSPPALRVRLYRARRALRAVVKPGTTSGR